MATKKTKRTSELHIYTGQYQHPAQAEIFNDPSRFRVVACGRKWGKSSLAKDELIRGFKDAEPSAYMCPTYKMLAEMWRMIKTDLIAVTVDKSEQEHRLETSNGFVLHLFSLDNPDAARPFEFRHIVVDEGAFIPNLLSVWENALYATLMKLHGTAMFLSSPLGFNDFHTLWEYGQPLFEGGPSRVPDWKSWQMPSWANPHLRRSEIETLRLTMSATAFMQEIEAQFTSDSGSVFRHIKDAAVAIEQQRAVEGHTYVIGADLAKTNDFSVFAVIDVTMMALCHIDVANHIDYKLQGERLVALARKFRAAGIVVEQNANLAFVEELQQTGLPFIPFTTGGGGQTGGTKALIIDALAAAFDNERLTILPDPQLISQLLAFQAERLPSGSFRYSASRRGHDDYVMALAFAYHAATYGVPKWEPQLIDLTPVSSEGQEQLQDAPFFVARDLPQLPTEVAWPTPEYLFP